MQPHVNDLVAVLALHSLSLAAAAGRGLRASPGGSEPDWLTLGASFGPQHLRVQSLEDRTGGAGEGLKAQYPFYHTSDEIRAEANALQSKCNGALAVKTVSQNGVDIDVATVRAPGAEAPNRVFILFGEHSRELISPESGLHLLKTLCGETDLSDRAPAALQQSEFQLVLNGNPNSRRKVEQGEYCLRVNANGVDLNRNWDEEWQPQATQWAAADTNPGPGPFSETETNIFRQLVSDFRPTTFLTVHSGTRGMYMPWAFDMEHLAKRNQPEMMEVLKKVDEEHCQCPFGAAGKEVGYSCPGTCLDWVYDQLETPFAFAFEIYASPSDDEDLKSRWQQKMSINGTSLLQRDQHLGHSHFKDLFKEHPSDFVQLKAEVDSWMHMRSRQPENCFANFNPDTRERYQETVDNWVGAYIEMAAMTASKNPKSRKGTSAP